MQVRRGDPLNVLTAHPFEALAEALPEVGSLGESAGEFLAGEEAGDLGLGVEILREALDERPFGGLEFFFGHRSGGHALHLFDDDAGGVGHGAALALETGPEGGRIPSASGKGAARRIGQALVAAHAVHDP